MKHYINREIVSRVFARIPQGWLDGLSPARLILPYYHIVSDEKVAHLSNLYPFKGTRAFTEDLDYLRRHFDPVGLGELLQTVKRGEGFPRPCFHLTFDDGFRELHDVVAPILIRKGIPATFFINSAFTDNKVLCHEHKASILAGGARKGLSAGVSRSLRERMIWKGFNGADIPTAILSVPYDRRETLDELAECMGVDFDRYLAEKKPYLDSSQVRHLIGKGFTIGSHSIDHPPYANIRFEEQVRQTVESTRWVREEYGLKYGAFAFPYTDRKVGDRLFREILASGMVDITFGTGGLINGSISRHLQRLSLEKPVLPADRILAMEYARKVMGKAKCAIQS